MTMASLMNVRPSRTFQMAMVLTVVLMIIVFQAKPKAGYVTLRKGSTSLFRNKSNLLFVKTHKCGTSTLVNMLFLYGIRRKLNFVLNPYGHQLESLNVDKLIPPRHNSTYNIQLSHYKRGFDSAEEHAILPKSTTLYTSIVRHPNTRFESAFFYFNIYNNMRKVCILLLL